MMDMCRPEPPTVQDEPLPECDWSEHEWNTDPPESSESTSDGGLGGAIASCIFLLVAPFKYAGMYLERRDR